MAPHIKNSLNPNHGPIIYKPGKGNVDNPKTSLPFTFLMLIDLLILPSSGYEDPSIKTTKYEYKELPSFS
jgi:hypothetical protein